MSWALGFDRNWNRDVGYGVPAFCDAPGCNEKIDRGLSYVCGGEPFGGEHGCGLHFCGKHTWHRTLRSGEMVQNCKRCLTYKKPYTPKPDHPEWVEWKLTDASWAAWRAENADLLPVMQALIAASPKEGKDNG